MVLRLYTAGSRSACPRGWWKGSKAKSAACLCAAASLYVAEAAAAAAAAAEAAASVAAIDVARGPGAAFEVPTATRYVMHDPTRDTAAAATLYVAAPPASALMPATASSVAHTPVPGCWRACRSCSAERAVDAFDSAHVHGATTREWLDAPPIPGRCPASPAPQPGKLQRGRAAALSATRRPRALHCWCCSPSPGDAPRLPWPTRGGGAPTGLAGRGLRSLPSAECRTSGPRAPG